MNTQAYGVERGTLIRVPATANLFIDSEDRTLAGGDTTFNFQITKRQALLNGFFSRIGTTEMVLNWCEPNISPGYGSDILTVDLSGTGANAFTEDGREITFFTGSYTVKELLDAIVGHLNAIPGSGIVASVVTNEGDTYIDLSGGVISFPDITETLVTWLGLPLDTLPAGLILPQCADLRPYRYVDFVCEALTSVQDVKDSSTAAINRDVLLRWYFSEDVPEQYDAYGYPIRQGYLPFNRRRIYNPPKQIKWEQNLPVGNLRFTVFDPQGALVPQISIDTNWLMTLQLSEG